MIKSILLAVLLFVAACGGGGGGNSAPIPQPNVKSWVQTLIVDDQFDGADVVSVLYRDPLGVDNVAINHGVLVAKEIQKYTNSMLIGYVPFYDSCFNTYCSSSFLDFTTPVEWAGDNNIQVVNISWSGCCGGITNEKAAKYAFDRGTTVVWAAGNETTNLVRSESPYMIVVGSNHPRSNYGKSVDIFLGSTSTSLAAARASGLIAELYEELSPTKDAAGAALIRDEFMKRYNNGQSI